LIIKITDPHEIIEPTEEETESIAQFYEFSESSTSSSEEMEEVEEIDENDYGNLTYPFSSDPNDFSGTTFEDAVNDKMHPPNTEWPNEIYREFMEIIMEFQLSNSCGDRIIKLFDKSKNCENNSLPKNTKEGRKFLDASDFPYMKFKKTLVTNFQNIDYEFYYQLIIHGIKVLLL